MQSDTCKPGTSFSHVGSAHVPIDDEGNMADDETQLLKRFVYFKTVKLMGQHTRQKVLLGMHHSDSPTGGRIFGPGFGRQPLLVSGNLTQTNMRKASQSQHDINI